MNGQDDRRSTARSLLAHPSCSMSQHCEAHLHPDVDRSTVSASCFDRSTPVNLPLSKDFLPATVAENPVAYKEADLLPLTKRIRICAPFELPKRAGCQVFIFGEIRVECCRFDAHCPSQTCQKTTKSQLPSSALQLSFPAMAPQSMGFGGCCVNDARHGQKFHQTVSMWRHSTTVTTAAWIPFVDAATVHTAVPQANECCLLYSSSRNMGIS